VRCMQGLLLAIARGVVPAIAVDHALSDDILDVVPIPEWSTGYVHEVKFEKWETKHRQVRTSRPTLTVLVLFPKYNVSCTHTHTHTHTHMTLITTLTLNRRTPRLLLNTSCHHITSHTTHDS
jgi:hypothetical protein